MNNQTNPPAVSDETPEWLGRDRLMDEYGFTERMLPEWGVSPIGAVNGAKGQIAFLIQKVDAFAKECERLRTQLAEQTRRAESAEAEMHEECGKMQGYICELTDMLNATPPPVPHPGFAKVREAFEHYVRYWDDTPPWHKPALTALTALEREHEELKADSEEWRKTSYGLNAKLEGVQNQLDYARIDKAELGRLNQLVCDFQAAAMIDVGNQGGPCLVEPRHVESEVTRLRAELAAMKGVCEAVDAFKRWKENEVEYCRTSADEMLDEPKMLKKLFSELDALNRSRSSAATITEGDE